LPTRGSSSIPFDAQPEVREDVEELVREEVGGVEVAVACHCRRSFSLPGARSRRR
jgi:hypothetical protein